MDLDGQWAVVTGAGCGIGKGCALELARRGANLVVNDRPGSSDLAESVSEIEAMGRTCVAVEADAFSRDGCGQIVDAAVEVAGQVDILVSNPAYSQRQTFLDYDPEEFEKTIRGTLTAGFHMGQLVARHMVEKKNPGRMVFISSVQAYLPIARCIAYGAAKAGLNHMVRTMAVELFAHRINVNAIEPGWIDTPGEHDHFGSDVIESEGRKLPWGRLGTPQDIGRAATFLVSPEADYITGTILRVDGGFVFRDCRADDEAG